MDRFRQLQVFIQVMESGNFTRAAEILRLPRSTVSTEIQHLEDRLKTQLFLRTTRKVVPTQDGRQFLEAARDIVDALTVSEGMFGNDVPSLGGRLRVDVPSRIGRKIVLPELPELMARHPDLSIDLSASDRMVDLVAEGVDCALRLGVLEDSELVYRKLGDVPFVTCASPGYLARFGEPESLDDLAMHQLVNYATHLPAANATLDFQVGGHVIEIELRSPLTVDGAEPYIAAATSGLGLIQVPEYDVRRLMVSGSLLEVLPAHKPPSIPLSFLYVRKRNLSPKVRLFQSWLEDVLIRTGVVVAGDAAGER